MTHRDRSCGPSEGVGGDLVIRFMSRTGSFLAIDEYGHAASALELHWLYFHRRLK